MHNLYVRAGGLADAVCNGHHRATLARWQVFDGSLYLSKGVIRVTAIDTVLLDSVLFCILANGRAPGGLRQTVSTEGTQRSIEGQPSFQCHSRRMLCGEDVSPRPAASVSALVAFISVPQSVGVH